MVLKSRRPLRVADARENQAWRSNPHVKSGIISYLGVPISWPDGQLFGTICVRDNKKNEYSEAYLKLLLHFRDVLQADLASLATLHGELEAREAKIGSYSRPISSGSSSGMSKVEFLRPTKRFSVSSRPIAKISSPGACAGVS